jgi:hypothetical protein
VQLVSTIRSRDKALDLLLPKFFGILCEMGKLEGQSAKAIIDGRIELQATKFRPNGIMLSAYAPTKKSPLDKVFSAHLATDRSAVDPAHFPYQAGRCGILSWKRGAWEDRIVASAAKPHEIAQLLTFTNFNCALTGNSSEMTSDDDLD